MRNVLSTIVSLEVMSDVLGLLIRGLRPIKIELQCLNRVWKCNLMSDRQRTILELWPVLKDDMTKFISDRSGWFIDVLRKALDKKGSQGWRDVETVINILQFRKDAPVEY